MQALVFDLDGTLLQLESSYGALLETAFEAVSGSVEPDWLETYSEAFGEAMDEFVPNPAATAFEATAAPGDPEAFAHRLHEAEIAAMQPPENAVADLKNLAEQFSLAVLTNGPDEWQRDKLDAAYPTGLFDAVVTSYDAGGHKPAPEPYRNVESKLSAEEYAMVGDSDSDIQGADTVGWQSVRYTGQRVATVPDILSWA